MADKPILALDVDGVLLNYLHGFLNWLKENGHRVLATPEEVTDWDLKWVLPDCTSDRMFELIAEFSVLPQFSRLPIYDGALDAVQALREEYPWLSIVAITSAGNSPTTEVLRRVNLEPFKLDEITVIPLGASKREHLSKLPKGSIFVDDLHKHVLVGEECGHQGVLFRRPYNTNDAHPRVINDWDDGIALLRSLIEKALVSRAEPAVV